VELGLFAAGGEMHVKHAKAWDMSPSNPY